MKKIKVLELTSEFGSNIIGGLGIHVSNVVNEINLNCADIEITVISFPDYNNVINKSPTSSIPLFGFEKGHELDLILNNFNILADNRIESEKFDLIHVQDFPSGFAALVLQKKLNIPLIVTLHESVLRRSVYGGYELSLAGNISHDIQKRLCEVASKVICVSQSLGKEAIEYLNCDLDKIEIIPNGIAVNKKITKKESSSTTNLNILFVGRFVEYKGIIDILEIAKFLRDRNIQFEIKMVGSKKDNIYEQRFQRLLEEYKLKDNVKVYNFVPNSRLIHFREESDICLIPSYYEPFGITVLEAMVSNSIVIGYSVGGIQEIIDNGINGFLVEPHNFEEMAKKIIEVSHLNKGVKAQLKKRALDKCRREYDWKNISETTAQLFRKVWNDNNV
jgi:glycosyltransferase involved in cell wall biosynthesis